MNEYPAGMTGAELDDERSLEEVIDNADRKEIVDMIFSYMTQDQKNRLFEYIYKMNFTPKDLDNMIDDLLHEDRNLLTAKDFIKDNCPEIAE